MIRISAVTLGIVAVILLLRYVAFNGADPIDPADLVRQQTAPADAVTTDFAADTLQRAEGPSAEITQDDRPNVVLISLDDAECELLAPAVLKKYLPNMNRLAVEGLTFTNCHVTTPLCGPSRTCLLYSQQAHRTGVRANQMNGALNNGYEGGYGVLERAGIADEHLGRWMHDAGYRTLSVGKYLHALPPNFAPSGWDEILMSRGDWYVGTSYTRARAGDFKQVFSSKMEDFRTDYESSEVESMLRLHKTVTNDRREPFFLYIAPMAPHEPTTGQSMIAQRHQGRAADAQMPAAASFDEEDFSDKPPQFQSLARLGKFRTAKARKTWIRRIEALMSVDQQIGRLQDVLAEEDELSNTLILLTSDHGYLLGHHRMFGKQVPYNRVTNVPLIVWSAAIAKQSTSDEPRAIGHLVSHLDLAPTLLEVAGADCPRSDGASFAKLFGDPQSIAIDQWRSDLLIENFERKRVFDEVKQCAYVALRMRDEIYVNWANDEREYYDLSSDPDQLTNRISDLEESQIVDFERRLRVARCPSRDKSVAPVVTLSRATMYEPLPEGKFEIAGLAEDDVGVEQVELSIQHPVTEKFWNGTTWGPDSVFVKALLGNAGGILSTWKYQLPIAELGESEGLRVVIALQGAAGRSVSIGPKMALAPVAKKSN